MVVVNRFPCLSETFIRNEIIGLAENDFRVIVATCEPRATADHDYCASTELDVVYPPPLTIRRLAVSFFLGLAARPLSTLQTLWLACLATPLSLAGLRMALTSHFIASHHARQLASTKTFHIHGHFLDRPGLVGQLISHRLKTSYSLSAHARDVFVPQVELRRLCEKAAFVAVCSELAKERLAQQLPANCQSKLQLCYHGIAVATGQSRARRERVSSESWQLITVGRLVPKKGIDVILEALKVLKRKGLGFRLRIAGAGPEESRLRALANRLGLVEVEFLGAQTAAEVDRLYSESDVMLIGCRVAPDGDQDGIPNVVLEAMIRGLPIVASCGGGIPEVVQHRVTGMLGPMNEPQKMADNLQQLLEDETLRNHVASSAIEFARSRFDFQENLPTLVKLLAQCYPPQDHEDVVRI